MSAAVNTPGRKGEAMRLLAPLREHREVAPLLSAGADEFYCGLTPPGWAERFGAAWANRRDPRSSAVTSLDELDAMIGAARGKPLYVALNSPHYPPGAVEMLAEFGAQLLDEHGVDALIVANLELVLALAELGKASSIHLSSLATCINDGAARFYRDLGISRIVLPRHLTLSEIALTAVEGVELEAFILNDGCVFEEGLCATTHLAGTFCTADAQGAEGIAEATLEGYAFWKWTLNNCGCRTSRGYPLGPCALCAIGALAEAGVTSLKIVGREASLERKRASVEIAARARDLAAAGVSPEGIRDAVVSMRGGKSLCDGAHTCYYPDLWAERQRMNKAC